MTATPNPDPAALASALTVDAVKQRVVRLVLRSLDETETLLAVGDPDTKMKVMGKIIPTLMRALQSSDEDNSIAAMQEEMRVMHEEMMRIGQQQAPTTTAIPGPSVTALPLTDGSLPQQNQAHFRPIPTES